MKLEQLYGDVRNAYPNVDTCEKCWERAGPEFGEENGKVVVIKKALYGLKTSAKRWHSNFSNTLRGLGFVPTRFDSDMWIKLSKDKAHYDYICTHIDDFCIFSCDTNKVMENLREVYEIKYVGTPSYYLENDYKKDRKG